MSACRGEKVGRQFREMQRGDTFVLDVQVLQSTGAPADITGWTMWFTVKNYVSDPDSIAVFQGGNSAPLTGIVFTTPTAGQAEVTMPSSATLLFPDGPVAVEYDVQGRDPSGRVFTIEFGELIVWPDVTRAI